MVSRAGLRYPGEWLNLIFGGIFGLLAFLLVSIFSGGLCCLWGSIVIIIVILWVQVENNHLKDLGLEIKEDTYPELHLICKQAAKNLDMELPKLYLDPSKDVNAFTRGIITPTVVLNQGLVDTMNDGEILFTVGHEMGHVKLLHFGIITILDRTNMYLPWILFIPLFIYRLLFLYGRLSRSMEYSADRAGLHACGDIKNSVSTLIKLKYGDGGYYQDLWTSLPYRAPVGILVDGSIILDLLRSHPKEIDRLKKLIAYSRNHDIGWDPSIEWLVQRLDDQ